MAVDIFVIVVVLWAIYTGWQSGLLRELTSGIGFFVGLFVAATCYSSFAEYLVNNGMKGHMATSIIAFVILWVVSPLVLGVLVRFLTKGLDTLHVGIFNRLGGAAVSLFKFIVLLSCIFCVMSSLHLINTSYTSDSHLYNPVKGVVGGLYDGLVGQDQPSADQNESTEDGDITWIEVNH